MSVDLAGLIGQPGYDVDRRFRPGAAGAPPPGTKIGGSRQAMTTRPIPLAMIRSAHGTGLDARAAHGSSELYRVAPASARPDAATGRSARPILASATSSA